MLRISKLLLLAAALAAFGWAFTHFKPVPQVFLALLPLIALTFEVSTTRTSRSGTFLLAASITSLSGLLFAGSELAAHAAQVFFPSEHRAMAVGAVFLGAVAGSLLFALEFFMFLKPGARLDSTRRAVLAAFSAAAMVSFVLDRLY